MSDVVGVLWEQVEVVLQLCGISFWVGTVGGPVQLFIAVVF